ncbi:MAG: hypothetical protein MR409_08100 [Lachnospiraceae bacterium]|nr:hypothetical protein [Lachnospiraceae bacterium]
MGRFLVIVIRRRDPSKMGRFLVIVIRRRDPSKMGRFLVIVIRIFYKYILRRGTHYVSLFLIYD